ncbi:NAD+ synthase [candidate division WOR-3 bacterium]|uniref:Glutamine-dependent NAD(+) synthetase n=1 Tax=candidate division WOR-3 bacterium TaxID=2052148 RepID=A0A9D5K7R6_UNCW3|nr:NAD+ synthase [candidate division WOR-3 bacterium]MBD3363635.1 NAD+ synthase [candidate division WOR-3 bacterium]
MKRFPPIALCQIDSTVGDLYGNAQKIIKWIGKATEKEAELIVFPELCLTGCPPGGLISKTRFLEEQRQRLEEIAAVTGDRPVIVGCVDFEPRKEVKGKNLYDLSARVSARWKLYNAAAVLRNGKIERYVHKTPKSNDTCGCYFDKPEDVGDSIIALKDGTRTCITISDYLRDEDSPETGMKDEKVDLIVNISASPFYARKFTSRLDLLSHRARELKLPLVYVNAVGGQDDLIFDGRSAVVGENGRIVGFARGFEEDLFIYCGEDKEAKPDIDETGDIWSALVLGIRDYVHKNGFQKVILGVSGGIDSALVACLAAEALGSENVLGLVMPSRYTSKFSLRDALLLTNNLRIETEPIPIDDLVASYKGKLESHMDVSKPDVTVQNIQARIRGNLLMAFSNKFGHLLLATGNKSEFAMGYATLYGDMCGGLAPIGDVPKTCVYELANWFNNREGTDQIPSGILERAPSAELAPGQRDQDDLPPYELLDKVLELYLEEGLSSAEIAEKGFDRDTVEFIINRIDHAEYKRIQAPVILKITPHEYGHRMPVTNRYGL